MDPLLVALRAVAEPTRLRILALCAEGELTVTDLTGLLNQSQPRVSRHLKILVDAGVLTRYREGTFAVFRLTDAGVGAALSTAVRALLPGDDAVLADDRARMDALKADRTRAAEHYFQANAERWDEIRSLHINAAAVEQRIETLLSGPVLGDVLDLGTGTGRMLALLAPRARRLVGIDQSREMLAVARANLQSRTPGDWQVRHGDLYALPVADGGFDVAVMHLVLHYLEAPEAALREARRVLRSAGRLLIIDYAPHDRTDLRDDHRHRWLGFDDDEIGLWLDHAGFGCAQAETVAGTPLSVRLWLATARD